MRRLHYDSVAVIMVMIALVIAAGCISIKPTTTTYTAQSLLDIDRDIVVAQLTLNGAEQSLSMWEMSPVATITGSEVERDARQGHIDALRVVLSELYEARAKMNTPPT